MAKVVVTIDAVSAADVIQFIGDTKEVLWVVVLNALNPVTGFNEFTLQKWNTGEFATFPNSATWSSKLEVYKVGSITPTEGIVYL